MNKIFETVSAVRDSIATDKTITLVAGCFDLLHVGHLDLLEYAKSLEDILVVCVLSDIGVRSYKNIHRPVIKEIMRAKLVAGLGCVDRVYIADKSPSDHETLSILKPQSLVYGVEPNSEPSDILVARVARISSQFQNIKIHYSERSIVPRISTSSIIESILLTQKTF